MSLTFRLKDTSSTKLWDFGWFDVSTFLWSGSAPAEPSQALAEFIAHPLYRRSFCNPEAWGQNSDLHGPYHMQSLNVEDYRRLEATNIAGRVQRVLGCAKFNRPPDPQQLAAVEAWLHDVTNRFDGVFELDSNENHEKQVEWRHVWTIFHEFVCISSRAEQIQAAVIGYD